MLHEFLAQHRDELIRHCAAKVARRPLRQATPLQLRNGIPLFLAQLQRTLEAEQLGHPVESLKISGASGGGALESFEMGISAAEHGRQLSELGYTVDQVVHDYGDLCQAITEMAVADERQGFIAAAEFQTLNRCLDNAIAAAVTAFGSQQDLARSERSNADRDERLGTLFLDLGNGLATASYAVTALEQGNLPVSGATGSVLKRSLAAMRLCLEHAAAAPAASHQSASRTERTAE